MYCILCSSTLIYKNVTISTALWVCRFDIIGCTYTIKLGNKIAPNKCMTKRVNKIDENIYKRKEKEFEL